MSIDERALLAARDYMSGLPESHDEDIMRGAIEAYEAAKATQQSVSGDGLTGCQREWADAELCAIEDARRKKEAQTEQAVDVTHKCSMTKCRKNGADWWNPSTRAWYCKDCAKGINKRTYEDSKPLCLSPANQPPRPSERESSKRQPPELFSDEEKKRILQKAEWLWEDLQKNDLGGYSGINRPFFILWKFREVIEEFGKRDVGLSWSKNDLKAIEEQARRG